LELRIRRIHRVAHARNLGRNVAALERREIGARLRCLPLRLHELRAQLGVIKPHDDRSAMYAATGRDRDVDNASSNLTANGDGFGLHRSAVTRRGAIARRNDDEKSERDKCAGRLAHRQPIERQANCLLLANDAHVLLDRIVLGSASPRRLELLKSLGLDVEVRPSTYDEPDDPDVTPLELVQRHARGKALDVRSRHHDEIVVAADTVVDIGKQALGRPRDAADAARMLGMLSGREHEVHTAFALAVPGRDELIEESSTTRVRFFSLDLAEIDEYVASGEPMDKAGAYGIQGRAAALVESIAGDFYTVMGFPLARFVRALRRLGFTLPSANENRIK